MKRSCDICDKQYQAKQADLKRGWGLCCSKRCAAVKRERSTGNLGIYSTLTENKRRLRQEDKDNDGILYKDEPYMGLCDLT